MNIFFSPILLPKKESGPVFLPKLRYIVGFWLVETAVSTNQKPTMYRSLYENTGPVLLKSNIQSKYPALQSRKGITAHCSSE